MARGLKDIVNSSQGASDTADRIGATTALRRRVRSRLSARRYKPQQISRRSQLDTLPLPAGRVVFLGDSITEHGQWQEWFPDIPVVNRGVGGETSGDILERVDGVINSPSAVMLLMGTNDIGQGKPTEGILNNLAGILDHIDYCAPGTSVVVQSIMPRALSYRGEVLWANERIREIVASYPENIRYLDLWPALATPEGALRPELSEDELHLNGPGYQAWVHVLEPVLRELTVGSHTG